VIDAAEAVLAELRQVVADRRGLPEAAVTFMSGTTIGEIEAEADQLAALLAARTPEQAEETEPQTMADVVANATTLKRERQRALLQSLHSPAPQPRDEGGRFTGGFGGGARAPVAAPSDPERDHGQLVAQLAQHARAHTLGPGSGW
jgi:hypothetical protein